MAEPRYEIEIFLKFTQSELEAGLARALGNLQQVERATAKSADSQARSWTQAAQAAGGFANISKTLAAAMREADKVQEQFLDGARLVPQVLSRGSRSANELATVLQILRESARGTASAQRALRDVLPALSSEQLKAIAGAKTFTEVQAALARQLGVTGSSTELFARAAKEVPGVMVQQASAIRIAAAAQKELETRNKAAERTSKQLAAALQEDQRRAARAASGDYRLFRRELDVSTRAMHLQREAGRDVAETLVRELGGALVTTTGYFSRLQGIGTTFANTLGRQLVRGSGDATSGLTALLNRQKLVDEAFGRMQATLRRANTETAEAAKVTRATAQATFENEKSMTNAKAAAAGMGLAIGGATIAIAAAAITTVGLVAVMKELAERGINVSRAFESTAIRAAAADFVNLKDTVYRLSNQTGVALDQLGASLGRALLKTGGDAAAAQKLLKVATDTALAAITEPETAVEHLGDVMRSYRLEIDRVKDVSNALLVVQRTAREDFDQLSRGISALAPQAAKLGLSFEDVAANVAGIARAGVPAQQAVFGLRSIFAELEQESSELRIALRRQGVDVSATAFKTKGLTAVFAEMERALNKGGLSLNRFLGESRRGPTLLALLGAAGNVANEALREMTSGVDQSADALARLQALPGRQITNFLNELNNTLNELGELLVRFVAPTLQSFRELLHELNEAAKEHPSIVDYITFLGGKLATVEPVIGRAIQLFLLIKPALDSAKDAVHSLRLAFPGVAAGAAEAGDAAASFGDKLKAISDGAQAKFEPTVEALAKLAGLQARLKLDNVRRAVELAREFASTFGLAGEALAALVQRLREVDDRVGLVTVLMEQFSDASAKQALSLEKTRTEMDLWIEALGAMEVEIPELTASYARWNEEQETAIEALRLQESALRAADAAIVALAAGRGFQIDQIRQLKVELRDEYAALARREALLRRSSGQDRSVLGVAEDMERLLKAAKDSKQAVLEFYETTGQSTLGVLELQLKRTRDAADALQVKLPLVAAEMRKVADEFERLFVQPRREGVFGGIAKQIKDFVKAAKDGFELGRAAATQFIDSWTDSLTELIAGLGSGKAAFKDFAVAVLQEINKIIARLIAIRLTAGILGALFGGGGGAAGGSSIFPGQAQARGGVQPFARGGVADVKGFAMGGAAHLRMGGVATRPTMFAVAERQNMAEAFVPLPGSNRRIPVELRGSMAARQPTEVNVNIAFTSQSLDPRTAADVFHAQIPLIARGIAAAIHGHKESELVAAIRGVGR